MFKALYRLSGLLYDYYNLEISNVKKNTYNFQKTISKTVKQVCCIVTAFCALIYIQFSIA